MIQILTAKAISWPCDNRSEAGRPVTKAVELPTPDGETRCLGCHEIEKRHFAYYKIDIVMGHRRSGRKRGNYERSYKKKIVGRQNEPDNGAQGRCHDEKS